MTHARLDDFESALLTDLRQEVGGRGATPPPSRRRRGLAIAGTIGTAAVAVAVTTGLLSPSDAFAVKPQANGDVVVTIDEFSDADGLAQALADKGIEADVDYSAKVPEAEAEESRPGGEKGKAEGGPSPMESPCFVDVTIAEDGTTTFRLQTEVVDSDAELTIRLVGNPDRATVGVGWSGGPC